MNGIAAHTVENTPTTRAAPAVSLAMKSRMRCGSTGIIRPAASMSSVTVQKMKAKARPLVHRLTYGRGEKWSGRPDLNRRPPVPQTDALPDCATPRPERRV